MSHRGVVVEIHESFVIVLSDNGEFVKLKLKRGLEVGQTILYLQEDLMPTSVVSTPVNRKWVSLLTAVAACLVLWLVPQFNKNPVYAVLSVDINPSFELELDENQKIINVLSLNESASILEISSLKGLSLQEGLAEIEQLLKQANYELTKDAMLFSLSFMEADNSVYEEQIKESLRRANISTDFVYLKVSSDDLKQARRHHMTGAKIKVGELLQASDVSQLSVNEIIQQFNERNLSFDMHCHDGKVMEPNKDRMSQGEGCPMH